MSSAEKVIKGRRSRKDSDHLRSEKKKRGSDDLDADLDLDLSRDIKGIISALQQIREKAQKDGQKKSEETIGSVGLEIRSMLDDAKSKLEKERQSFVKAVLKNSREFESKLKSEYAKLLSEHDKFNKEKTARLQTMKDIFGTFEDEKKKLFVHYEQQRKKEKTALSELEKACAEKIANAEESLRKKKQDDKSFSILRKTLGSFLDTASDDDFEPDE